MASKYYVDKGSGGFASWACLCIDNGVFTLIKNDLTVDSTLGCLYSQNWKNQILKEIEEGQLIERNCPYYIYENSDL